MAFESVFACSTINAGSWSLIYAVYVTARYLLLLSVLLNFYVQVKALHNYRHPNPLLYEYTCNIVQLLHLQCVSPIDKSTDYSCNWYSYYIATLTI